MMPLVLLFGARDNRDIRYSILGPSDLHRYQSRINPVFEESAMKVKNVNDRLFVRKSVPDLVSLSRALNANVNLTHDL